MPPTSVSIILDKEGYQSSRGRLLGPLPTEFLASDFEWHVTS